MNKEFLSFAAFLADESTNDVCFACHVSPDGDTLGSAFALARLVRAQGRRAFVFVPDAIPDSLSFLSEDFDNTPFEPKTVVAVDVSAPDRLGESFLYADRITAVIDHHKNNSFDVPYRWVEPGAAATGLLVLALCDEWKIQPDAAVATALYTAISTDTGRFCHSNTTEAVFAAAARLARAVPEGNFGDLNRRLFVEQSADVLRLKGYILSHAQTWQEHSLVFFALTQKIKRKFGLDETSDLVALVDVIRSFGGYSLFVLAKEQTEPGVYKLSVRSEGTPSAMTLCSYFGGGGHEKAAGCTVRAKNPRDLKKKLLKALVREGR